MSVAGAYFYSPLGRIFISAQNGCITGVTFGSDTARPDTGAPARADARALELAFGWLDAYFGGKKPSVDALPLQMDGTDFQRKVWSVIASIPYGSIVSYGEIARMISGSGISMLARAVGNATGSNPICLIVPCHRVVRSDGKLGGYSGGGAGVKIRLLRFEEAAGNFAA